MKETILKEVKKGLTQAIDGLSLENLQNTKAFVIEYFELLEKLRDISELVKGDKLGEDETVKVSIENNTDAKVELIDPSQNKPVMFNPHMEATAIQGNEGQNTEKDLLDDFNNYEVREWQLSGGAIAVNKKGLKKFIPESVVRNQEIHLADIVQITDINQYGEKKDFKLIEKGEDPNKFKDNRVVYQKCEVEIDDGRLVVKKDMYGNEIKIDEVPFTFVIKDHDRTNKNIEPGHCVDIAFYEGKAHEARVIWRYSDIMVG